MPPSIPRRAAALCGVALAVSSIVVSLGCGAPPKAGRFERRDTRYAAPSPIESAEAERARCAAERPSWPSPWPEGTVAFVGRVLEVEEAPGYWSGIVAVPQRVRYRVEERIRGQVEGDVVVSILIVGPPATEVDDPRLASTIWYEGARHVVACVAQSTGDATPYAALVTPYRADRETGALLRTAVTAPH